MKHLKRALVANLVAAALIALGLLVSSQAEAATCFWVGTGGAAGGGSYTSANAVNWASSSNGANSSCAATGGVPKNAGDVATFDSAANGIGSNTVTADGTVTGLATITIPTGTGTFNFGTGTAITLTTQFSMAAAGATVNCGTSTITLSGNNTNNWSITNGTVSCASGTIIIGANTSSAGQTFAGNGQSYGTLTIVGLGRTGSGAVTISGSNTIGNFNIAGPVNLSFAFGVTNTVTNAFNWAGTPSAPIYLSSNSTAISTIAASGGGTINWSAIKNMTFTGSVTANNSFNFEGNTGATINPPSAGGGGIIGGGL